MWLVGSRTKRNVSFSDADNWSRSVEWIYPTAPQKISRGKMEWPSLQRTRLVFRPCLLFSLKFWLVLTEETPSPKRSITCQGLLCSVRMWAMNPSLPNCTSYAPRLGPSRFMLFSSLCRSWKNLCSRKNTVLVSFTMFCWCFTGCWTRTTICRWVPELLNLLSSYFWPSVISILCWKREHCLYLQDELAFVGEDLKVLMSKVKSNNVGLIKKILRALGLRFVALTILVLYHF